MEFGMYLTIVLMDMQLDVYWSWMRIGHISIGLECLLTRYYREVLIRFDDLNLLVAFFSIAKRF